MDKRADREKVFHDDLYAEGKGSRLALDKYYSIMRYSMEHFTSEVVSRAKGKRLLEYGCGTGRLLDRWLSSGLESLTVLDISKVAVEAARESMAERGLLNVEYLEMNAEELEFNNSSFDLVCGTAILHHLDLDKAFSELARVLNDDGHGIFYEPLGHNVIINLYRRLTPKLRSADEHPLYISDLAHARKYFRKVEVRYFNLLALMAVPFRKTFFFKRLLDVLHFMDSSLARMFPFLGRYYWCSVIHLSSPIKK